MRAGDRRIESKPVSLTKQNDPKQNYSIPANLKIQATSIDPLHKNEVLH